MSFIPALAEVAEYAFVYGSAGYAGYKVAQGVRGTVNDGIATGKAVGKGIYNAGGILKTGADDSIQYFHRVTDTIEQQEKRQKLNLPYGQSGHPIGEKRFKSNLRGKIFDSLSSNTKDRKNPTQNRKNRMAPRKKSYKNSKRKSARSKRYRKDYRNRYYQRVPRVLNNFPRTQLCKLNSVHSGYINAAASSAVGYMHINANNPKDPLNTGVGWGVNSTEHHPKHWDRFSQIWGRYEPISVQVTVQFIADSETASHAYFIVPSSQEQKVRTLAQLDDTLVFCSQLQESNRRAIVQYSAATAESQNQSVLQCRVNFRKLEGVNKGNTDGLQATTAGSNAGETSPTLAPAIYAGVGALQAGKDLTTITCIVSIETVILFSDLVSDVHGASVA